MTRTVTQRRTLTASTLKGDVVRNPQNENLGKVEDLMIDLENGRIAYCVVSLLRWTSSAWATSSSRFPGPR